MRFGQFLPLPYVNSSYVAPLYVECTALLRMPPPVVLLVLVVHTQKRLRAVMAVSVNGG